MVVQLYAAEVSPCVRSVLLTIEAINLKDFVIVPVDLFTGGHQTPEYAAINPLKKVPTLQDGKLIIWDSHAINGYLVDKYSQSDSLYPKDVEKRALIDAMNHFDTGFLFAGHDACIKSLLNSPIPTTLDIELAKPLLDAYGYLNDILISRTYVAGPQLTIADFSIATTISQAENYLPLKNEHNRVIEWYEKIQSLPYWKRVNSKGLIQVQNVLKTKLIPA